MAAMATRWVRLQSKFLRPQVRLTNCMRKITFMNEAAASYGADGGAGLRLHLDGNAVRLALDDQRLRGVGVGAKGWTSSSSGRVTL